MFFRIIFLAALTVFLVSGFAVWWFADVGWFISSVSAGFWSHVPGIFQIGIVWFIVALVVFLINVFSGNR